MINCALISQGMIVVFSDIIPMICFTLRIWFNIIFKRLNVEQTLFGAEIQFSMRTFHFKTQRSSVEQQQTMSCNLHLDRVEDISSTQPDDCTCYSENECLEES